MRLCALEKGGLDNTLFYATVFPGVFPILHIFLSSPAFFPSPRPAPFPLSALTRFFFTSLSIPPSPTLQLFSTLCRLGFRQAGSYQATGYALIGSVSASVFLPGSCMGLTAVMYRWLLIPRSQGGRLAAELGLRHQAIILFSGWTFASLDEVTHGIAMLPQIQRQPAELP